MSIDGSAGRQRRQRRSRISSKEQLSEALISKISKDQSSIQHVRGESPISPVKKGREKRKSSEDEDEKLSPFSRELRQVFKNDRSELSRIASELEVAENTIYRWMKGISIPRVTYLKHLLDALPQHRNNLTYAINQTFPGVLDSLSLDLQDVRKDIYSRILDLACTTAEADVRCWQVIQEVFEYALLHLDAERLGISITLAKLMPTWEDGIHSLYEANMRGTPPWPMTLESKAYLGSTTLAGMAAMLQRTQTWDALEVDDRLQVVVDEHEKSACAHPVMRAGNIAGVLIVSSTQAGFFAKTTPYRSIVEYAQLLNLAFNDKDFYAPEKLRLRPMPDLKYQRQVLNQSFLNRVMLYAQSEDVSRTEAELQVRRQMEREFELSYPKTKEGRNSLHSSPEIGKGRSWASISRSRH